LAELLSSGIPDIDLDLLSRILQQKPMATLNWKRDALKALLAMQPKRAAAIRAKCLEIAANPPPAMHSNLLPLTGVPNGYRIRFGDWRVSFRMDPESNVMEVFEVAARGGAYRW
jgi:mRNA-degrading endonuclease RelE of RelBE toxin-antitoxin system